VRRSRPLADTAAADLSANTTTHLVADIERLRQFLGVERWLVCGGSWGTALALAYAQRHPHRVEALVLFAVTAGTRREVEWITRDMRRMFPREWDELARLVPDGLDVLTGYVRLLADPVVTAQAAAAWCAWEDVHTSLTPGWQPWLSRQGPRFQQVFARLVTHYWANGCFLDDVPILAGMDAIADLPGVLIHGRRDVSGPLDTAWDLHKRWPASRLVVLDDAGHGGESILRAIIEALATS
jgi:proline iminopeptidase